MSWTSKKSFSLRGLPAIGACTIRVCSGVLVFALQLAAVLGAEGWADGETFILRGWADGHFSAPELAGASAVACKRLDLRVAHSLCGPGWHARPAQCQPDLPQRRPEPVAHVAHRQRFHV